MYLDEMLAQGHPLVFNERRGNLHTTVQAATGPKTSLYTGTAKKLPLYTQETKGDRNKTYRGQKFVTGIGAINAAGLKYFGVSITLSFYNLATAEKKFTIKHT